MAGDPLTGPPVPAHPNRLSTDGYLTQIPGEHRELLTALRAHDAEAALKLFATHRGHALDVLDTGRSDASSGAAASTGHRLPLPQGPKQAENQP
jgi:hypothetical protein